MLPSSCIGIGAVHYTSSTLAKPTRVNPACDTPKRPSAPASKQPLKLYDIAPQFHHRRTDQALPALPRIVNLHRPTHNPNNLLPSAGPLHQHLRRTNHDLFIPLTHIIPLLHNQGE
ncbi:hypothetical protein LTR28_011720 [Elasticomyces elasticus]|nr:hypothetical protein LTR28_011720 [Elasticomyces elasticus]